MVTSCKESSCKESSCKESSCKESSCKESSCKVTNCMAISTGPLYTSKKLLVSKRVKLYKYCMLKYSLF
jgi:hypothetical protein